METFNVAHLNLPGPQGPVDVVIVFLSEAFDRKPEPEKHRIRRALGLCAGSANFAGNVVPVWVDASGRTKFIAPQQQHAFFSGVSYQQLYAQANKTMTCE
jgi:hypothetical protein